MSTAVLNRDDLKVQLRTFLGDDLRSVNDILSRQFQNPNPFVQDVAAHVSRFQGKQIRPMLVLLSARLFQPSTRQLEVARCLAAVVEMIHTATLVHDDVIDDASLRRHLTTVHRRWNTETSVLFGDYLLSKSFHLAATTGDAEACRLIGRATDRTCEGELNQMAATLEQSTRESDYFRIIIGKTGQLFGLSCQLGARAAGASDCDQRRLRVFGRRLGMAFQIADDILDVTASAAETGKDAGNDQANQRLTLPMLRATRDTDSSVLDDGALRDGVDSARATAADLLRRAVAGLSAFEQTTASDLLTAIARVACDLDLASIGV